MSVPQSPVEGRRQGGDSRIPRPSSLTSPMTSPVPLRRAGSLRLRGEKSITTVASLTSPRQKHFPTINESSAASPRHHRSLQSLTPRRPSIGVSPNPADDDDNDSLRSFGSTQSACDHAHFARNGTTFSGRRMKYVVHCSPQHETDEYLTPTQRAARQERRLKALLAQARRDIETKDECIFRLTKEVVELRLLRGDAPPDGGETEDGSDATESRTRQNTAATQWTKANGFGDIQSPIVDSASGSQSGIVSGIGDIGDGPPSGLATPVSLSDSGHFDDALTAAVTNGSSPAGGSLALDERRALLEHLERRLEEQARRHAERALEDRRALVELYERKMEEMSRRHVAQTQEERRELESAYEKRLIEAARSLAEEKGRAETALRERDALRLNVEEDSTDTQLPAGLEKRLADALQRLQALQRSPSREVKKVTEKESSWDASSIQRVEEALSNLEKRVVEERTRREEALKSVQNLSDEIGDLERRLADEAKTRELAVGEAEKLRESDLMNSVRISDLETRLSEELRIREQNDGEVEGLRERIRLGESRLADLEARLLEEIKRREDAERKFEEASEALSLKEVRLAELQSSLSDEVLQKQALMDKADELWETIQLQATQARQLEERLVNERMAEERDEARVTHLEKTLAEERMIRDHVMKDAQAFRENSMASEALVIDLERRLAQTEVAEQSSNIGELQRKLAEEQRLREDFAREVEQLRPLPLALANLEKQLEEMSLKNFKAIEETTVLRKKLDQSESQNEDLQRRNLEESRVREEEIQELRAVVAEHPSRLADLERTLCEEQKLREEIAEEAALLRANSSQLEGLRREEEKLIREEAISQGLALQERLKFSEIRQVDLEKCLEEERRHREDALKEADELREAVSLLSAQLHDLQKRLAEEQKLREEIAEEAALLRANTSQLEELRREVEEEKLIREEAISQGLVLQERLKFSETRQVDLEKRLEEERRHREDALKEADELREAVSLLSAQLHDLQRRFAEELNSSEDRQREAEDVRGQLDSLKDGLRAEWETRLADLTLALEEEQRRADSCQSQLDQFRANVQNASEVSQDLENRLVLASQAAEALEKDLGERLQEAEQRCKELESERDGSAARIEELSKALKEQEERHKDINLEMYRKGQEAAKFERRDEVLLHANAAPTAVAVPELLAQLESTEKELDKLKESKIEKVELLSSTEAVGLYLVASFKAMYRRLVDSQAGPSNPEATLMFLKSAFYYFLTDEANSQGHLNAIQSILGFSELERQAVESHTYFRR